MSKPVLSPSERPRLGHLSASDWQDVTLTAGSSVRELLRNAGIPPSREVLAAVAKYNGIEDFAKVGAGSIIAIPEYDSWSERDEEWAEVLTHLDTDVAETKSDAERLSQKNSTDNAQPNLDAPRPETKPTAKLTSKRAPSEEATEAPATDAGEAAKEARRAARRTELEGELDALLKNRGTVPTERLLDAVRSYVLTKPTSEQKQALAKRIAAKVHDPYITAHAQAYLRNPSGNLETHDYVFFAAQGWKVGFFGGLATGEETLKAALLEVTPQNRALINQKLWTYYPPNLSSITSVYKTGYVREDAPLDGSLLPLPAGLDPLSHYVKAELSGKDERWLLAVPRIPRDAYGLVPEAYQTAFDISELDDEEILHKLEDLTGAEYVEVQFAFSELVRMELVPEAEGVTLAEHAQECLDADELKAFKELSVGLASGTKASREAAARYAALRLDASFGTLNDDEKEMMHVLTHLVGDGSKMPTFKEIASHSTSKNLGKDIIDEVADSDEALAKLIIEKSKPADHPEIVVLRLLQCTSQDAILALLKDKKPSEIAAMHAAAGPYGGAKRVRDHIAKHGGPYLDGTKKLPSETLLLWDLGDVTAVRDGGELYVVRDGLPAVSSAARLLYAMQGNWWDSYDSQALLKAARQTPEAEKPALIANFQALASKSSDTRPLTSRLSEVKLREREQVERAVMPKAVSTDVKVTRSRVDEILAEVEQELSRGFLISGLEMERGATREAMRVLRTELKDVFDGLEAQRKAGGRATLSPADAARLSAAIENLYKRIEVSADERAAITENVRTATILVGVAAAAVLTGGAAAALAGSKIAALATAGAVLKTAAPVAWAVGGAVGATVGSATDGIDFSSQEFVVNDLLLGSVEGASLYLLGPGAAWGKRVLSGVPALGRIALADASRLGKWGRVAQGAFTSGTVYGTANAGTAALGELTKDDWNEVSLWEKTTEVLAASAKSFGKGAAVGGGIGAIMAMRGAARLVDSTSSITAGREARLAHATEDSATLLREVPKALENGDDVNAIATRLAARTPPPLPESALKQGEMLEKLGRQAASFNPKDYHALVELQQSLAVLRGAGVPLDTATQKVLHRAIARVFEARGASASMPSFADFQAWIAKHGEAGALARIEAQLISHADEIANGVKFNPVRAATTGVVPSATPAPAPAAAAPAAPRAPGTPPPPPVRAKPQVEPTATPAAAPATPPNAAPRAPGTPPPPPVRARPQTETPAPTSGADVAPSTLRSPTPESAAPTMRRPRPPLGSHENAAAPTSTPAAAPAATPPSRPPRPPRSAQPPADAPKPAAASPQAQPAAPEAPTAQAPAAPDAPTAQPTSPAANRPPVPRRVGPPAPPRSARLAGQVAKLKEQVAALEQTFTAAKGLDAAEDVLRTLRSLAPGATSVRNVAKAVAHANEVLQRVAARFDGQLAKVLKLDRSQADDLVQRFAALRGQLGDVAAVSDDVKRAFDKAARQADRTLAKAEAAAPDDAAKAAAKGESLGAWSKRVRDKARELTHTVDVRATQIARLAKTDPQGALANYIDMLEEIAALQKGFFSRARAYLRHPLENLGRTFDPSTFESLGRTFDLSRLRLQMWWPGGKVRFLESLLEQQIANLPKEQLQRLAKALDSAPTGVGDGVLKATKKALKAQGLPRLWRLSQAGHVALGAGGLAGTPVVLKTGAAVYFIYNGYNNPLGGAAPEILEAQKQQAEKLNNIIANVTGTPVVNTDEVLNDPAMESPEELSEAVREAEAEAAAESDTEPQEENETNE